MCFYAHGESKQLPTLKARTKFEAVNQLDLEFTV